MPLLILTGFPKSGKSSLAKSILSHYQTKLDTFDLKKAFVISEHDCDTLHQNTKDAVFQSSIIERQLRAELKSEVQKHLESNILIIVDGLNYLKSFRYELFCVAKAARETFCVVYPEITPAVASDWNSKCELDGYSEDTLSSLISRYEPPSKTNRWDSPLIHLLPSINEIDVAVLTADVDAALFRNGSISKSTTATTPNLATLSDNLLAEDITKLIEKTTSAVCKEILQAKRQNVPRVTMCGISIDVATMGGDSLTPGACQKLRRAFQASLSGNQLVLRRVQSAVGDSREAFVVDSFVDFVRNNLAIM